MNAFCSRVLTTHAEVAGLALEWRCFLSLRTPYAGPGFALSWLRSHPEAKPCVVVVRDLAGRLIALAPWCLVTRPSGVRVLIGIGGEETWFHDPLFLDDSQAGPAADELAKALRSGPGWDAAFLTVRPDLTGPLKQGLGQLGWVAEQTEDWRQSYLVEFGGPWEDYWAQRSRAVKRKSRNMYNRLAAHTVRWLEADEITWEAMLGQLLGMHQLKLGHIKDWSLIYAQMRAVAEEALRRKELGLLGIEVDGKVAALELSVRRGARAFAVMCAYDRDFADFSVGELLHAHTLEYWCRAGLSAVDLGPGKFDWKDRFATGVVPMTQLAVAKYSLVGTTTVGWTSVIKPMLVPILSNLRSAS